METPRTPFAEQARQTQDPRTALEASRERAACHARLAEHLFDLFQRVRTCPRIAMKKEEEVATRHSRSEVHLCRALAPGAADDLRPRRVGQRDRFVRASAIHDQDFVRHPVRLNSIQSRRQQLRLVQRWNDDGNHR